MDVKHTRVHSNLHCDEKIVYPQHLFSIDKAKGELTVDGLSRDHSDYCINQDIVDGELQSSILLCPSQTPFVTSFRNNLKLVMFMVSDVSILAMFVFHIVIPELCSLHFGYMKMAFLGCLFVSYLILFLSHLASELADFTGEGNMADLVDSTILVFPLSYCYLYLCIVSVCCMMPCNGILFSQVAHVLL